ncbi:BatD family protein [Glaciecola sp. MF2-115]|uniref:BatD family protein n=1 Tax=Glaciecola sp. MF2-115 TaxID=3384827 RepID=UPI0039A021D5
MKHNSVWYLCLVVMLFSLALMTPYEAAAKITDLRVSVDKNPIMIDEAVQLIISAEGEITSKQIDLSALEKDFRMSSTSISQSTRSINFNTTKTTTWVTQLFPKKVGKFTIPSFEMDGQKSQAFNIIVTPVGNGQGATPRDFYVTANVDMKEVYLQQQIKYTTKLHLAKDIQRGSLQAPELENAIVKQVGEDKEYEDFQNGVRYRVIERTYAIIPQASGEYEISGTVFSGEAVTDSRQSFGFISRTKPINRVAPNIKINVLPIPNNYQDHWLPSEFVQLNEEWQQDPSSIVLGQPITRTITLTAAGLVEEQLPEIAGLYPPDFKTYPDQATTSTVDKGAVLFAQKIQSEAIIPNKVGTFVVGEVVVPWFNVVTKQTEYAKLPARSVEVLPPSEDAASNIEVISPVNQKPSTQIEENSQGNNNLNLVNTNSDKFQIDWLHISLFVLWLLSLLIFGFMIVTNKRSNNDQPNNANVHDSDEAELWNTLRKTIQMKNIEQTNQTLHEWLTVLIGQDVNSVNQCFTQLNAEVCVLEYNKMMKSAYGNQAGTWESTALLTALSNLREQTIQQRHENQDKFRLYPKT